MEKIKEKPALSERVKEKAVSAPKELLRKVLDDGSERLRTQLRDTAQHGQADEYGGDAIEDTAASGLRRAEKELLKQRKKKNAEQSWWHCRRRSILIFCIIHCVPFVGWPMYKGRIM